jgi:SAM-dependent methyltransferase
LSAYGRRFYLDHLEGSRRSAREIVPLVMELVRPQSVIDLGCGLGAWLSVFREQGVKDIWGVDGDWIQKDFLQIPPDRFQTYDLALPFTRDRQFDLVMSLEVAEHLPPASAPVLVDSLVNLGPVILFAAAIPCQGGLNHINEQWPEYWAELFSQRNYGVVDCLRKQIWHNPRVKYEHAQNILLFVDQGYLEKHDLFKKESNGNGVFPLSIVHPQRFLAEANPQNMTPQKVLSVFLTLPNLTYNAMRRICSTRWQKIKES